MEHPSVIPTWLEIGLGVLNYDFYKMSNLAKSQSGFVCKQIISRAEARAEREAYQRYCAKLRYKAARRAIPKPIRQKAVRLNRRLKEEAAFLCASLDSSDLEPQSGLSYLSSVAGIATNLISGSSLLGAASSVQESTKRVADSVETASTSLSNLLDTIRVKIEEFATAAKTIMGLWWVVPVGLLMYAVYREYGSMPLIAIGLPLLFAKILGSTWAYASKFFGGLQPQDSGEVAALLATLVCSCFVPYKSEVQFTGEILKRVGSFDRSVEGFKSLFEYGMKYAEKLINAFLSLFTESELHLTDRSDALLRQWMLKVDSFERVCRSGNPTLDQLQEAVQLQIEGIGFRQVLRTPHALAACNRYTERIGVLLQAHRGALNAANAFRQQPVFLVFGGLSGVGKTSLLKNFGTLALLVAGETTAKEAVTNLWQKGTTQFWNGYVGQKCLVLDDCFQEKPMPGKDDSEYMQIIRSVGNWAYPLNYADLESKGRFYFNSPLMIGTTNLVSVKDVAGAVVNCPEAVVRRIQYGYWIEPHPDWSRDGRLDYARVEKEFATRMSNLPESCGLRDIVNCFPWEAWRAIPHDFAGQLNTGAPPMDLSQLVFDIGDELKARKGHHYTSVAALESWLQKVENASNDLAPQGGVKMGDLWQYAVNSTAFVEDLEDRQRREHQEYDRQHHTYLQTVLGIFKNIAVGFLHLAKAVAVAPTMTATGVISTLEKLNEVCDGLIAKASREEGLAMAIAFPLGAALGVFVGTHIFLGIYRVIGMVAGLAWSAVKQIVELLFGSRKQRRAAYASNLSFEKQSNVKEGPVKAKANFTFKRIGEEQLGVPPKDPQQDYIYENTYKLVVDDCNDPQSQVVGQVQFIEGNLAVMPEHFRRHLRERRSPGDVLWFLAVTPGGFKFKLTVETFLAFRGVKLPGVDLEFVRFDVRTLKSHRSIMSYLLDERQMAALLKCTNTVVRLDVAELVHSKGGVYVQRTSHRSDCLRYVSNMKIGGMDAECLVEYKAQTKEGDCGAPLCIAENRYYGGRSYIGFHVAGSTGVYRYGYATYVTLENAQAAAKVLGCYRDRFHEDLEQRGINLQPVDAEEQSGIVGDGKLVSGSFLLIGKVDKPLSMAGKTALKASPLQEDGIFGEPPTMPAILRPIRGPDGEIISPMVQGLKAYQSDLEYRDVALIDGIVELATKKHLEVTKYAPRFLLTPEEAVVGVEGLKLKKIARDTSAGYPYRLDGTVGKKAFFGETGDYQLDGPEWEALRERALYVVDSAKQGIRLAHVFTDFLKDELRPLHKVESVATRVISGAPLDYVIAVRMYFGAFLASMFSSHTESGMAPGINHYTEWHRLATRLLEKGDRVFGGDFSRFDSSEQPYVHMKILEYINRWYARNPDHSAEDDRVREILWLDLIHSRHLSGDSHTLQYVVQWNKSLPSGHPLTTPVNSLYSLITLTACYVHATGDIKDMWDKVFINTFGDDNVCSVSETVSEVFNQVTVSKLMKDIFNLTYTSDKKGAELIPYEDIEKVTFLKRSFKRDGHMGSGGWVGPLARDSFLYIPYWYRNNRDPQGDLLRNIEHMLGELCLHEPDEWDKYYQPLFAWASYNDLTLPFSNREAARDWISTRTDVWY
uniref:Uncharacterized protein n=1 Tax=Beihai picorna-like virus 78 TaxID=1922625 RepID=A0A1L3KGZ8_9VIRU|nr:hypothetical protein 1 [Beihai picorna-like virus 78]